MSQNEFVKLRMKVGLSIEELSQKLDYSARQLYRWEKGESKPRSAVLSALKSMAENIDHFYSKNDFKFIDLFAGIGGLRIGFESTDGRCIFTSEWNKYSQITYAANFRDDHSITGDITQVHTEEIPNHDLLIAGFPCQPFSIAGVSKKKSLGVNHGFACETQGTLFFDIARIIKDKKPAAFMLENVKNLQSHDKGKTFRIIIKTLCDELGYYVWHKIIDAKHFLPQHRERIVIVGFREKVNFSWDKLNLPERGIMKMDCVLHPEDGSELSEPPYTIGSMAEVNSKYTLSDKLWKYLQNYAAKHKAKGNGFGFGIVTKNDISRTLSARYYKDGSEILVSQGERNNPRRLTPRECARLMGYSDNFLISVSDTQAYKQFGNSVAIPVFKEVARLMHPHILSILKKNVYQGSLV